MVAAMKRVVAGAADQRITAIVAMDCVVARTGTDRFTRRRTMYRVVPIGAAFRDDACPERAHAPDGAVVEGDLLDPVVPMVVQGIPQGDLIVGAGEAQHHVVAAGRGAHDRHVVGRIAVDQQAVGVVAAFVGNIVHTVAAGEHIGVRAVLTLQPVVAQAADQRVVAVGARQGVVAQATVDHVVGREADDGVVASGLRLRDQDWADGSHAPNRAVVEHDLFDAPIAAVVQRVPDRDLVAGAHEGQNQLILDATSIPVRLGDQHLVRRVAVDQQAIGVVAAGIGNVLHPVAAGEHIGVRAVLALQPVVAQAADQRVVAVAAPQVVVAQATADHVIGYEAGDRVVAIGLGLADQALSEGSHAPDCAVVENDLFDAPVTAVVQGIPDRDLVVGSGEGQDQLVLDTVAIPVDLRH